MNMKVLWLQAAMVLTTMAFFVVGLFVNELVFSHFEFTRGVNWIYLPAGIRLLATLLFAEAGALGLLLVSWLVCFLYFFPNDVIRSIAGGILATLAPYLVYRVAQYKFGLHTSLANLSSKRLLFLIGAYSLVNALLHHLWFGLRGEQEIFKSFFAMFVGDLTGTLIVVYFAKTLISIYLRQNSNNSMP